jgi:ABC-type phosphate transport system auxiliary subunit
MSLSAKEAAESVGITKQGIIKSIREGKISAEKNSKGQWCIEPVELYRVYTPLSKVDSNISSKVDTVKIASIHQVDSKNINDLEHKIELLEKELSHKEEHLKENKIQLEKSEEREKDLSAKLDKAQSTIERQTYLISDMREKTIEKPVERPKRFFGMFSRSNS